MGWCASKSVGILPKESADPVKLAKVYVCVCACVFVLGFCVNVSACLLLWLCVVLCVRVSACLL